MTLAAASCSTPTDGGPPPVVLDGSWGLQATSRLTPGEVLTGTLVVTSQSGVTWSGTFTGALTAPAGGAGRAVNAPVTGRVPDGRTLDFTLAFDLVRWQFVGRLDAAATRAEGSWVDLDALVERGTFVLERTP